MPLIAPLITHRPNATALFASANGGGGGSQVLSQSGNTVSLSGGGGSVDISTTTSVASSAQKTTAQTYSEGLLATSFDGDIFTKRAQVGSALEPTTLTVFQGIDQIGDNATHTFFTSASVPQASVGLVSGVNLNIASSGSLSINTANTGSGNGSVDIIEGQVRMNATEYVGVLNGTDIRLSGGLIDNSLSSGSAGQFLSAGAGGEVVWATGAEGPTGPAGATGAEGPTGSNASVGAGSNIDVDNSTPGVSVVAVAITSYLDMNAQNIINGADIDLKGTAPSLNFLDSLSVQKASLDYSEVNDKVTLSGISAIIELVGTGAGRLLLDASAPSVELRSDDVPLSMRQYDVTGATTQAEVLIAGGGSLGITSVTSVGITAPTVSVNGTLDMTANPITNALTVDGATLGLDVNGNLRMGDATTSSSPTGDNAVALGSGAGSSGQGPQAVAIGFQAGQTNQAFSGVAMGYLAGQINQGADGVAIGQNAGNDSQGSSSVAIGGGTAISNQGEFATALGANAGAGNQGNWGIAVGYRPASENQGENAISIGSYANATQRDQGTYAISIGSDAYSGDQPANSILINATGVPYEIDANTGAGFYVQPVRAIPANAYQFSPALYNNTTGEICSGASFFTAVIVTAPSSNALTPSLRGRTYIATSAGAQTLTFTRSGFTANDAGFYVKVKNGNAVGVGDITIAGIGISGNLTVHSSTVTSNGGIVYLYWTGVAFVSY